MRVEVLFFLFFCTKVGWEHYTFIDLIKRFSLEFAEGQNVLIIAKKMTLVQM